MERAIDYIKLELENLRMFKQCAVTPQEKFILDARIVDYQKLLARMVEIQKEEDEKDN